MDLCYNPESQNFPPGSLYLPLTDLDCCSPWCELRIHRHRSYCTGQTETTHSILHPLDLNSVYLTINKIATTENILPAQHIASGCLLQICAVASVTNPGSWPSLYLVSLSSQYWQLDLVAQTSCWEQLRSPSVTENRQEPPVTFLHSRKYKIFTFSWQVFKEINSERFKVVDSQEY